MTSVNDIETQQLSEVISEAENQMITEETSCDENIDRYALPVLTTLCGCASGGPIYALLGAGLGIFINKECNRNAENIEPINSLLNAPARQQMN